MAVQSDPGASALLTTALEKLLYLESRLDAAEAAREDAAREAQRQRIAAQAARQALSEWQKRATNAEVTAEGAEREVGLLRSALGETRRPALAPPDEADLATRLREAEERLTRYDREREAWLDRMVVLGRLRGSEDELDLGSFISELRAELLALRRGDTDRRQATVGDRPALPNAEQLLQQIPSASLTIDVDTLLRRARLDRPARTLASICARDLRSDSPAVRRRAAERLCESGIQALTPLAITLISAEPEARVRVALVALIALSGDETATLALARSLGDVDPLVRAAALDASSRRPNVDLTASLSDASPAVRRRAIALLPRRPEAIEHLAHALRDEDASVRHVAALALTRRSGPEADALLQIAASSSDPEVRGVARAAIDRRQGVAAEPLPTRVEAATPFVPEPVLPPVTDVNPPAAEEATGGEQVVYELDERLVDEIRTSLRGRTIDELASRLDVEPDGVAAATERLLQAQLLVWRGRKLYLA
jgi:hypothetical protein